MTGTERKVFQKYYPPDFDPKNVLWRPSTCNVIRATSTFTKEKKFNMRRETAEGETYLGMKIFRFYFRCPNCLADISFKTDIENVDYTAEHGATRLFEAFKSYQEQERRKEEKEEAEKNDAMKMLEKRTKMSRAEMEAIGKLEELQEISKRQQLTNPLEYLEKVEKEQQLSQAELHRLQDEEDEREIARLLGHKKQRIVEEDETLETTTDDADELSTSEIPTTSVPTTSRSLYKSIRKPPKSEENRLNAVVRIVKKPATSTASSASKPSSSQPASSSLLGLAADYGSSSGNEDE
ncbi:Splicing factor YJU2 [Aphelenchoides besseyi]|nr:Splicing factor YJU2 [Aphelenchoides besseyi]